MKRALDASVLPLFDRDHAFRSIRIATEFLQAGLPAPQGVGMAIEALLQPVVLFCLLGALAAFVRSDLAVPEPVAKAISLYLMMSIGLRHFGRRGCAWPLAR